MSQPYKWLKEAGVACGAVATVAGVVFGLAIQVFPTKDVMDAQFEKVDARFEKVDARFQRLEEKVDARFEKVDAQFQRLEETFDARFEKVDARFERVAEASSQTLVAIARLQATVEATFRRKA